MIIIITGRVGVGKTTVCEKVLKIVRNRGYTCGGVLTHKTPDGGIIAVDVQTEEREILASTSRIYEGPRTAKYFFNPAGIEFGIKAIERGLPCDILFVDEIGHLELEGGGFARVIELIRVGKTNNCILVIRKELLVPFLSRLEGTPLIFEATIKNRNELLQTIGSTLVKQLPLKI